MSVTAPHHEVGIDAAELGALVSAEESTRRLRIVDAALSMVLERDLRSLSLEDVATRAGVSRATLYRWFPGGREELLDAALQTEVARLFSSLAAELVLTTSAEATCVTFLVGAARRLAPTTPLAALLADRTGTVGGAVTFEVLGRALEIGSDFLWPFFARVMHPSAAHRASELTMRVGLSYFFGPDAGIDLATQDGVEHLVARHVTPKFDALSSARQCGGG